MAKNFDKAGSIKAIKEVAKESSEKAQVTVIKYISNEDLIDNPENGEDITYTVDLEESMKQIGFTDPIEVTTYNMEPGKYMILSGHRRRAAGLKMEYSTFPCIVRTFKDDNDIRNYVLLSNSQRDSAKDPFLFTKRYKLHEEYLKKIGFKGSKREEIARRLGLSTQQADRYNAFNSIIMPVWDLVRAEKVGMSSVQELSSHTPEEQEKILDIMKDILDKGEKLTRTVMKTIVDDYRNRDKKIEVTQETTHNDDTTLTSEKSVVTTKDKKPEKNSKSAESKQKEKTKTVQSKTHKETTVEKITLDNNGREEQSSEIDVRVEIEKHISEIEELLKKIPNETTLHDGAAALANLKQILVR